MAKNIVIIESPYAKDGLIGRNVAYAQACLLDSINRGEAPYASHLLYTQVLDDSDGDQRLKGLDCAVPFYYAATSIAVYTDFGISRGMEVGINLGSSRGKPVEFRTLPEWKEALDRDWAQSEWGPNGPRTVPLPLASYRALITEKMKAALLVTRIKELLK